MGRWGMAMAREAWPNALNAQFFNSKVGVYFRGGLFPWGFTSYLERSGVFFRGGFFPQPHRIWRAKEKYLINYIPKILK